MNPSSPYVNVADCLAEIDELTKAMKTVMNHYNIPMNYFDNYKEQIRESITNGVENHNRSIPEQIKELMEYSTSAFGYRFGDQMEELFTKSSAKHTSGAIARLLTTQFSRGVAMRILIDKYSHYDDWTVKSSQGLVVANRQWRSRVLTSTGYYMNTSIALSDKDNPVGTLVGVEDQSNTHSRGQTDIKFYIDGHWTDNVFNNGIAVVDIAGKPVLTLCATLIEDHDLLNDNVEMWQAKVAYTKVPKTLNTWRMQSGDWKQCMHIEDKVIAKQTLPSSTFITTGKDLSWATRTMRMRMKKEMFKLMDI